MIKETAYAKINLFLALKGMRDDGYHLISTVMQTVSLCDYLTIKKSEDIALTCSISELPAGDSNIAYRACRLFCERTGVKGADITLEKNIPMMAGLGGGSSDAAAVLRGMNKLYQLNLDDNRLEEMAAQLGADVPFFIRGGTALCEGIGEIITPLPIQRIDNIVVAMGESGISTKQAYNAYDRAGIEETRNADKMIEALARKNTDEILSSIYNSFTRVCVGLNPEIGDIINIMKTENAKTVSMSGSGAAVFGFFPDLQTALQAVNALEQKKYRAFICKTV